MAGIVHVVVGGQFGSESKGAVTAALVRDAKLYNPLLVRVAGPNAGHTAYDNTGRKWALRTIPVAAVVNFDAPIVLAAGSEIIPEVLAQEVNALEQAGIPIANRLYIDYSATVIEPHHAERETDIKTGTTGKGIGAARADRIMRQAAVWGEYAGLDDPGNVMVGTAKLMNEHLRNGDVIIEGTQGYGLGVHTEYYPYSTSSDCTAIDFMAMAGLSPWADKVADVRVHVVIRPHPIRIAGNSGPLWKEVTWSGIGQEPEYTTVTKLERRVGSWDPQLIKDALQANGGGYDQDWAGTRVTLALGFLDYIYPELADCTKRSDLTTEHWRYLNSMSREVGASIEYIGTGPNSHIWIGKND